MVFNLFKTKKNRSLGIDIGTSSIKIVELMKSGDKIELTNYGEYKGSVGAALHSSSVKLSSSQVADIIKEILREARIESREATMSVPVFSGFSTTISLPKMPEAELDQAVAYEAKKYIPLPISEVQFEWTKLNQQMDTDTRRINTDSQIRESAGISNQSAKIRPKGTRVLIVAVTNELINRYHEIAKLSGLTLKYLELETFSLARSLASDQRINTDAGRMNTDARIGESVGISSLIIDIGSRGTILTVVQGGWPVFTRSLDISGFEFSKLLSKSLSIDFARAEEFKKKEGINYGDGTLVPLIDNILMEGRRIVGEYARKRRVTISEIILSGGSAQMPGFLKYVVKSIGRETMIGFPFRGIIYPNELGTTLRNIGPSFSVAVGLALREFR